MTSIMNNLEIYHTVNKQDISLEWLAENNFVIWETCVRQILIGTKKLINIPPGFSNLSSVKAYRFLLEVICGLHSPMIGETEIMAQFKSFITNQNDRYISSQIDAQFWSTLQKEAKTIRSRYLKNYGQQTYGGIVLQNSLSSDSINILGSGKLASSILTHFSKDNRPINIHCRNQIKGQKLKLKFPIIKNIQHLGSRINSMNAMLVIAAPIETDWLEKYLIENKQIKNVVDLRSMHNHTAINYKTEKYLDLNQVFKMVEKSTNTIKENARLAKIQIAKNSLLWQCKAQHRPFGWEDMCVS